MRREINNYVKKQEKVGSKRQNSKMANERRMKNDERQKSELQSQKTGKKSAHTHKEHI